MTDRWEDGFSRGYELGWKRAAQFSGSKEWSPDRELGLIRASQERSKPKRRQSPRQKLLKQMTDAKWKKYKRGSGKKTWVQIRAEVSRSQLYKKKARRMK